MKTIKSLRVAATVFAGVVLAVGAGSSSAKAQTSADAKDPQVQGDVQKALDNKKYKDVQASVHDGNVTLKGTVDMYAYKEDADKRVHHVKNVKGVDNLIEVSGPAVDDATLRNKLAEKLTYDRVGYGTTAFNAITIAVQNGVVTLGGTAYGPVDKDSAVSLVSNYAGVKDVVDNVEVDPLSPMDDRLRIELARVIYGAPQLNRYAMDPAKPIRITVVNGNVILSGVVDSKSDSDVAFIRANGVPGVFKVTNKLQIAGTQSGS